MRRRLVAIATLGVGLWACKATTGRPYFVPMPEAGHGEIGFEIADPAATITRATEVLADALRADSIPVETVRLRDGYLETPWFDTTSLAATNTRPLGAGVVKVRGWVDPAKPGFGDVEVETVYIPYADPSRPERDLEAPVAADHPVAKRIASVIKALVAKFGEPDTTTVRAAPPGARPPVSDTSQAARPDSAAKAPPDTTRKVPPDTTRKVPPDTTRKLPPDTTRKAPPVSAGGPPPSLFEPLP